MSRLQSILLGVISAVVVAVTPAEAQTGPDPYYDQYGGGYADNYGGYTSAYNPYYDPASDPYYDPYCDYYTPPWGYPPDYCRYQIWSEPVYVGGIWYGGPIYYGLFWGAPWFWVNGSWWRDEWRGERPNHHDWNRGDHKRWDGEKHDWRQDDARGTWPGRNSWAGRNFGADADAARHTISTRNFSGGRDRNLDGRNTIGRNRNTAGSGPDRRGVDNGQRNAAGGRDVRNDSNRLPRPNDPSTGGAQNGRRFADAPRAGNDRITSPNSASLARDMRAAPRYGSGLSPFESGSRYAGGLEGFNWSYGARASGGGGGIGAGGPRYGSGLQSLGGGLGPRSLAGGGVRYGSGLQNSGRRRRAQLRWRRCSQFRWWWRCARLQWRHGRRREKLWRRWGWRPRLWRRRRGWRPRWWRRRSPLEVEHLPGSVAR